MNFIKNHYEKFKSIKISGESWSGSVPVDWFNWVVCNVKNNNIIDAHSGVLLQKSKVKRNDIFLMISDMSNDIVTCCLSILAWGGMNRKYGAMLFSAPNDWVGVAERIRNGELSRVDAYQAFFDLRAEGKLPGMRPAYYTKLIFFLMPINLRHKSGFIMDQWTSASVNILCSVPVVKVRNGLVMIENSSSEYEKFCEVIDLIAGDLFLPPAVVEQMMFSEGYGKGEWRSYVISHRVITAKASK